MSYWHRSQGEMFEKIYKQYNKKNEVKSIYTKVSYEPGSDKNEDDVFSYQKVSDMGSISKQVPAADSRVMCTA